MNKRKNQTGKKAKNLMYTQQLQHLPAGIQNHDDLVNLIESKLRPRRYAIIVHDKDTDKTGQPKTPDLHIMLSFDNARSLNSVAKILGDKPQYVEAWVGNANNGYAYLVHATRQAQKDGKHRYDPGEVTANFDYAELMKKIGLEVEQAKAERAVKPEVLLDMLYTGAITKREVEQQLTGSLYARYRRQIEDVWAKRLQNLAEKWREEMASQGKKIQVMWIYGPAGTGKTRLARHYADKANQPYFMSGSSRDPFQGYAGEHTLILDELRPKTIQYEDLLRILDPYSITDGVMAPSRYSDKALACDLIIITSPFSPKKSYDAIFPPNPYDVGYIDGFDQLDRRVDLTMEMTDSNIYMVEYNSTTKYYDRLTGVANNFSSAASPASQPDAVALFNSMFTP